jgi:hypothetical protein
VRLAECEWPCGSDMDRLGEGTDNEKDACGAEWLGPGSGMTENVAEGRCVSVRCVAGSLEWP